MATKLPYSRQIMLGALVGDAVLTLTAFALAITSDSPLAPASFAVVVMAIVAGNLLPLTAYAVQMVYLRAELKAENAKAGDKLRGLMARVEELDARSRDAADAAAKSILIARQVPDRIDEKLKGLHVLISAVEKGEISDALAKLAPPPPPPVAPTPTISPAGFKALEAKLDTVLARLAQVPAPVAAPAPNPAPTPAPAIKAEAPKVEPKAAATPRRLGRGLDKIIHQGVAQPITPAPKLPPAAPAPVPPPAKAPSAPEPDDLDEIESPLARKLSTPTPPRAITKPTAPPPVAPRDELDLADQDPADDEDQDWLDDDGWDELDELASDDEVELDDDEIAALEADLDDDDSLDEDDGLADESGKKKEPERGQPDLYSAEEIDLSSGLDVTHGRETRVSNPRPTPRLSVLVVRSMIDPDEHTLTLRGPSPILAPYKGRALPQTGVGEFRWEVELTEPIRVQLYLDDQTPALGEPILLTPGETVRALPRFPRG